MPNLKPHTMTEEKESMRPAMEVLGAVLLGVAIPVCILLIVAFSPQIDRLLESIIRHFLDK